ncbi:MAG: two pore domain potassium channel family protein [Actinobacteria bacterium]|nr:two pore domain potassium channel family protein [Actinomycetota bacterium]
MAHTPGRSGVERRFDQRVAKKGLHIRFAAYIILSAWGIGIVIFGLLEYLVNRDEYTTIWLALWWAIETVTTVGYGDAVPSNTAGKVVGAVLMLGGLSLYAVVTALITSAFVARAQSAENSGQEDSAEDLKQMRRQLAAIEAELRRLQPKRD